MLNKYVLRSFGCKSTTVSIMFNKCVYLFLISLITLFITSCGAETTQTYTLTILVNGEGTINPPSGEYDEGESVTINSSSSEGWVFENWSGDVNGTSNSITIKIDGDKQVTGNFIRKNYPLNVTIEGEGRVDERIVSKPKYTDYPFETIVELTPNPSNGWEFVEWSGDITSTVDVIQIPIDGEVNITVTFAEKTFYLNTNGISVMCPNSLLGETGFIDDIEYESVDRNTLLKRIEEGSDLSKVCTSLVTDMNSLFSVSSSNQIIGNWDVSNVTDMSNMFLGSSLNQPIGEWNVGNVKNMRGMFNGSLFNQPIENWDVGNVIDMSGMFIDSPFNQPIGDWNVSSVTDMRAMFRDSKFNQPIENWDVSKVTNMSTMFIRSSFNQPIGGWNISSVIDMQSMFNNSEFNQSIENWDVSKVNDMTNLFANSPFNQSIGKWDVSNVIDLKFMFTNSPFNQPIGNWNVSNVTDMSGMFYKSLFNQPLGNWDVSNVYNMKYMFADSPFNQPINNWCVSYIGSEPDFFSTNSPLTSENKPVWRTCP